MSAGAPVRVRALSFQAAYRCRHSGACCSSGWEIAVEPEVQARLPLVPGGERALVPRAGPGDGARAVLRTGPGGRCLLLRSDGLCAVHAQLGEAALPSACRQFPRVVTLTPLGTSVTLSHYCPTAAGLLLSGLGPAAHHDGRAVPEPPDRIVESPAAFPASWPYQGLDARDALPPFLRPGVLMTWPALERWEEHAVATLTRPGSPPESALARLAAQAERARAWRPRDGPFEPFFAACLGDGHASAGEPSDSVRGLHDDAASAWDLVASTAVEPRLLPERPASDASSSARVAAGWPGLAPIVGRWLAAKAFASWLALQGRGLRGTVAGLHVALALLRAEAARGCAAEDRPLDAELLIAAVRRTDLLLVHLADPEALAREVSRCETAW